MKAGGCALLVWALFASSPDGLSAQVDTLSAARLPDTTHLMRPGAAFWRSLLLPGWGQSATGRHVTGAAFVTWEGITMMMTLKAHREANYLQSIGSGHVKGKRQEVQDWAVLWVFNHLFSGAEAYVSAHLQDFPPDLKVQVMPHGIGVTFPLPHR